MNQYNSYYLYQQYEKRGSQDWLPCYPNIFSVDGDGTMPLVMKKENDPDCGYTGDTQPIYRWYPLPITTDYICDECPAVQYRWENMNPSTDYYCDGTTKYYKQIRQYSYDSGTTWYDVVPPEYQQGSVYEQQSTDCGYVPPIEPQYRTTSGTPYCEGVDKYVEVYSQVSLDGGITWSTTATTTTLVEHNSQDCGYIEPQYRWETAPQSDYMCSGSSKYYKEYYEVSYDNGLTWQHVEPEQTRRGSLIEEYSQDCGYYLKYLGTYSDGTTRRLECESGYSGMLTRGEVQPSTTLVSAEVGDCVCVIDTNCFSNSTSLTSVTLTDNLLGFNESAFSGCTSLSSITIPSGVDTIAQWSFQGCTSLTGVTIPKLVESIPNGVFSGCTSMTSVVFEQGSKLKYLTNFSFAGCTSLTGVTIPSGVTRIDAAFEGCSSMSSVTFENGSQLEYLGHPNAGQPYGGDTFRNCSSLTGITLPSSVTWIGFGVFRNCSSLTSIDIPSGVTFIGTYAFNGCTSLTGITVNATTPPTLGTDVFNNTNDCPIYVPCDSIATYRAAENWSKYLPRLRGIQPCQETFYKFIASYSDSSEYVEDCGGTTGLTTATTKPNGYDYTTMVSAEIGDCITNLGNCVFSGCTSLTSITVSSSVTYLSQDVFGGCTSISGITIPGEVSWIDSRAFKDCTSLTGITIGASAPPTLANGNQFDNTNNCIIYVPCCSIERYRSSWSEYASRIQGIPPCQEPVAKFTATYNNGTGYSLACDSSTTLTSGNTRPTGYKYSAMTSAEIGCCVLSIGGDSFRNYSGLTSVTIPDSVTNIGDSAFRRCTGLTSVVIPNNVTSIGNSAFTLCTSITNITIPDSVTTIGKRAFYMCRSLTSCTIGSGVTSTNEGTFSGCRSLTSIDIPSGVSAISNEAFSGCTSLTSCTIGNGVTFIGNYSFERCSGLTSVTIPSGVTSIGIYAFRNCTSLTSVTVNAATPPRLGNEAFTSTNNCPIYVPTSSLDRYKSVWSDYASRIQAIP